MHIFNYEKYEHMQTHDLWSVGHMGSIKNNSMLFGNIIIHSFKLKWRNNVAAIVKTLKLMDMITICHWNEIEYTIIGMVVYYNSYQLNLLNSAPFLFLYPWKLGKCR